MFFEMVSGLGAGVLGGCFKRMGVMFSEIRFIHKREKCISKCIFLSFNI